MRIILLLRHLLSRDEDIVAACGDHVVSAVGGGVVDGLVLAHEEEGDAAGEAAERGGRGGGEGDVVPGAGVGETCLWRASALVVEIGG